MSYAEKAKKAQAKVKEEMELGWDSKLPAEASGNKEFSIPPVGEYNFMVVDADKTFAKTSGNPMLKVRLDLQGADGCVFDNLVISEKAMFKLISFFESVGVKEKGKDMKLSIGDAALEAMNREGRCKIKHETYNGEVRAKVDKYIVLAPKKEPEPFTAEEEAALDMPFAIDDDE